MAAYSLVVKTSARKEIEAIEPKRDLRKIVERIQALSANPRPQGVEKLAGSTDVFRVRQGNYRVVYSIDDRARVVTVIKVGHRREVYR